MATVAITPDQDKITAEIFIAAPPERVFPAITDPQQMPKWWGQQGMYRITEWTGDLRPGGKWTSLGVGADGVSFRVEGEYLEVDPPRLLTYTWIASWSGARQTTVRWDSWNSFATSSSANRPVAASAFMLRSRRMTTGGSL